MPSQRVSCEIRGMRDAFEPLRLKFSLGEDISYKLEQTLGPNGVSPEALDLLDIASAIYEIDRNIGSWRTTNPPKTIKVQLHIRRPSIWGSQALSTLGRALQYLSNAKWEIDFEKARKLPAINFEKDLVRNIQQVALFSGGLDSACGASLLYTQRAETQLVSFYKNNRKLQSSLATRLGFSQPSQWYFKWNKKRGRSFYLRSFFFLTLAGVVAESWDCKTIYQFENGILATAIPPSPSWMMTKHAHPLFHRYMEDLFDQVLGGPWDVRNPFLGLTKRECVDEAVKAARVWAKPKEILSILSDTESCWFLQSPQLYGAYKKPGKPCGVCVPCLIRLTALPNAASVYDIRKPSVYNDTKKGAAFRAYYSFLTYILAAKKSSAKFYLSLPPTGQDIVDRNYGLSLTEMQRLLTSFAHEFMRTFNANKP